MYLDKEPVRLEGLSRRLRHKSDGSKEAGVLIFADKTLPYQSLFRVLDRVRSSGLTRISLQAEVEKSP
jgi:biopolymer transport protein ExbD